MDNHISASFEIPTKDDELDLPSLYWMFNKGNNKISAILLGLLNAPGNHFPNYKHIFYQWSKQSFRVTVTLATPGMVRIRCGF